MNSNRRVLLFVVYSVGLLFILSLSAILLDFDWLPFQRVNLVSEVIKPEEDSLVVTDTLAGQIIPITVEEKIDEDFNLYQQPRLITNFDADTALPSLRSFAMKLHDLKSGKKRRVRIAYFGDSMIEGDLLTQTLRELLQETFGGHGVGFVPITSPVSKFRSTVIDNYSDGWEEENFKTGKTNRLHLSGHLFRTSNAWVQMVDQTVRDTGILLEKSLLCGFAPKGSSIAVNQHFTNIRPDQPFNRIPLLNDRDKRIAVAVANEQLPVYGLSFESESGIFVDNFSFRGITGIEYARLDSAFLRSIAKGNPYDLIVFQYGVNLLFRPNDKNFNWYAKVLMPVLRKMKNCFDSTDLIVVSTADRAFRYGGEYKSAIGIDSLIKVQALLAYETGVSFYNQFASMGGTNSIVDWTKRKPSLANLDYVHPNHRGAEVLGEYFFQAIMSDYRKYVNHPNP